MKIVRISAPKIVSSLVVVFSLTSGALAQIVQIEASSGKLKSGMNLFTYINLDRREKFSFAAFAFFQKHHERNDKIFDETGVQGTALWNISRRVGIGPSFYSNSVVGLQKKVTVLFSLRRKNFEMAAMPAVVYSREKLDGELFMQLQLNQYIDQRWRTFVLVRTLTNWNSFSIHSRSMQQIRFGILLPDMQVGVGIDADQYGPEKTSTFTGLLFLRRVVVRK